MVLEIGTSSFKWVVIGVFISAHITFPPFSVWKDLGHISFKVVTFRGNPTLKQNLH